MGCIEIVKSFSEFTPREPAYLQGRLAPEVSNFSTKGAASMLEKFRDYLQGKTNFKKTDIEHIGKHFDLKTAKCKELLVNYSDIC